MSARSFIRPAALALALAVPSAAFAQASASADTYAVRYDLMRREIGTIAPDPDGAGPLAFAATRSTYDAAGRLIKVEKGQLAAWQSEAVAPAAWTGFTIFSQVDTAYDAMNRKVREAVSGGGVTASVTEYGYDLAGRPKCTAVRMNPDVWATPLADKCVPGAAHAVNGPDRITRNSYTVHGDLEKVEQAVGTPLQQVYASYTYSPNGKRTSVTDANGNRAELTWDGLDRQKRWIFPSKTIPGETDAADYEEYGYDANASRTSLRKRDGITLTYGYDALNRMSQKIVPASTTGAPGYSVFYGYDNRSLQTYARFGSASGVGVTNVWDGFGQLSSSATNMDGVARAMSGQYDADGNRTALSGDQGYYAPFSFDGLGRMNAYVGIVGFSYDAAGRRSSLAMGPSWTSSSVGYGYDAVGRLDTLTHDLAGTDSDQVLGFAYNPASQVRTRSSSNAAYAWSVTDSYVRSYAANGLNQYTGATSTGAPSVAYSYDANGNLVSDGTRSWVYDGENRLVSASGAENAALAYDPLGRLWQVSGGGTATRFLYDGDRLVMELDGSGSVQRSYVHGPGADEPLVWYERSAGWARRFFHADQQGSIVALADDAGNALAIKAYDPWGIPKGGNVGRFGYTGQAWIPELGLWYYKARFYSPTLGRFLQTDPVGYEDQMNLYAYVGNDPVNRADPSGKYECKNKDCETAAKALAEIRAARNFYRSPAHGSLVPRNAAAVGVLNKILSAAGTKGDGGVNIAVGDLPGTRSGQFDERTNTITLDTQETRKQGDTVGEVLGHELQHYRQRDQNLSPLAEEARPIVAEYLIGSAPTGTIRGIGGMDYVRERLSRDYCRLPAIYCSPAVNRVMNEELYKPF